ncbi:MAG: OsmC family protein [Thermoplasmata archaeon]|nr:OsmC family protein [Thermoplasmata archaeon]
MEGRAVHIEGMKFLCESGNHSIVLDDGSTSITPVQALLLSMATCTAMDVWNIMVKKREKIKNLEVKVEGERREKHPKTFRKIRLTYIFYGDVDEKACRDAIDLSLKKYCSISNMIKEVADIEVEISIK